MSQTFYAKGYFVLLLFPFLYFLLSSSLLSTSLPFPSLPFPSLRISFLVCIHFLFSFHTSMCFFRFQFFSIQIPECSLKYLDVHAADLETGGMAALLAGVKNNGSLVRLNAGGHKVSYPIIGMVSCVFIIYHTPPSSSLSCINIII